MNKSELFKAAHKMTKEIIQAGDDYRVTFGACLSLVIAESKKPAITADSMMAAFKAESLNSAIKNWSACGIKNMDADIADFDRRWSKFHSDAREPRNRFIKNFFEKDVVSVIRFNGLDENDMNALVEVFGLDSSLKNKPKSRRDALIAAIKASI